MKATIHVGFSMKFPLRDFTLAQENDGLDIEVEAESEEDLQKQIEKWQKFIQKRVIDGAFKGANRFLEAEAELKDS